LSTDRVTRRAPELDERPFALVGSVRNARELVAVNDAAARVGLRVGIGFASACAIHPALSWAEAEPGQDARLLKRLAEWCERYTPSANPDAPDGVILEIGGSSHLFGGEGAMARDVVMRLKRFGFRARIGIADTAGCAWAVARHGGRPIIPAGGMREALAPLPVAALRISSDIVVGLRELGLKTIGDVMERPRAHLAARFGVPLMQRLDQALGHEDEPIPREIAI
jgi:protein ImuB